MPRFELNHVNKKDHLKKLQSHLKQYYRILYHESVFEKVVCKMTSDEISGGNNAYFCLAEVVDGGLQNDMSSGFCEIDKQVVEWKSSVPLFLKYVLHNWLLGLIIFRKWVYWSSYDWPSAFESTLKNIGKLTTLIQQGWCYNHKKTLINSVHILGDIQYFKIFAVVLNSL